MRRQDARNSRSVASLGMTCRLVRDHRIDMGRDLSKPAPFQNQKGAAPNGRIGRERGNGFGGADLLGSLLWLHL